MEQKPSNRMHRRQSPGAGAKAHVTDETLHIRYHHQEGTLRISKFGWLAALVALAAVVGALAFAPSADAAILTSSTKTCAATVTPNVFTCTYVVNWTGGSTFNGDTTAVTMTGPATYTAAITGVSNNPANCSIAIQAQTTTSFQFRAVDVVAGGCALAATTSATMTETVTVTGAGAVTQTALNGFSGTSTVAVATGLVFTPATVNSVTKVHDSGQPVWSGGHGRSGRGDAVHADDYVCDGTGGAD